MLRVAFASGHRGVIGDHQRSRIRPILDSLSEDDYDTFREILDQTSGSLPKAFVFKALTANNEMDDIAWFADQVSGKDYDWLIDNCTLGDARGAGTGIRQQYGHTCGVTTFQQIRGEYDPVYALRLRRANADINAVDDDDPSLINPHMAAEQRSMTETPMEGVEGEHEGVAAPRSDLAAGVGRWVDDWLNDLASVTGLEFENVRDPSAAEAIATLDDKVGRGMMTPTVIGNGPGQYTHYILCMDRRTDDDGDLEFLCHDPWDGTTTWTHEDDISDGVMDIAGSNMITALEEPSRATDP